MAVATLVVEQGAVLSSSDSCVLTVACAQKRVFSNTAESYLKKPDAREVLRGPLALSPPTLEEPLSGGQWGQVRTVLGAP